MKKANQYDILIIYLQYTTWGFMKKAFTLAEVLITLTIIGVIAAMTIPTLASKYQKHVYVVGLKKAYAELAQAFKMIPLAEDCAAGDYSCAGFEVRPDRENNLTLLAKQFKDSEIIDYPEGSSYLKKAIRTANGMLIYVPKEGMRMIGTEIEVDINSKKGPNKGGRDEFVFLLITEPVDGIEAGTVIPYASKFSQTYFEKRNPEWSSDLYWNNPTNPKCSANNANAYDCAGRVLEEDAMNY